MDLAEVTLNVVCVLCLAVTARHASMTFWPIVLWCQTERERRDLKFEMRLAVSCSAELIDMSSREFVIHIYLSRLLSFIAGDILDWSQQAAVHTTKRTKVAI